MTLPGKAMPSEAPSHLDDHLGYWLRLVSNAVSHRFARTVDAEGVTVAEWVLLRMLFDQPSIAPSPLAARMGMTKGAISKLADRLLDKRLIERKGNPADKRAHTLSLSEAGRALVPRLASLADANDHAFFNVLEPEQQQLLLQLLQNIAQAHGLKQAPLT